MSRKRVTEPASEIPKKGSAERRKLALEPLEPRILLSADPLQLALTDTGQDQQGALHASVESATLDHHGVADALTAGLQSADRDSGSEGDWNDDLASPGDDAQAWSEWAVEDDLTATSPSAAEAPTSASPSLEQTTQESVESTSDRLLEDTLATSDADAEIVAVAAQSTAVETQTATAVSPSSDASENDSESGQTESSSTSEVVDVALPSTPNDDATGPIDDGNALIVSDVPDNSSARGLRPTQVSASPHRLLIPLKTTLTERP